MAERKELEDKIANLPDNPGIYKFLNSKSELIYVGKAKNLKKRVSSYFNRNNDLDAKTRRLVSQVADVEFTIVDSEFDAFLLENNLIKSHQPKFNILLRDDKTYPYVYVSRERFPRIISTRKFNKESGTFYGPYTSVKAMNTVIDLIRKLFTVRTCTYNLSETNIESGKFKICLEYHIGNCKGPCEGLVQEEEYNHNIEQIHLILKGNISPVKGHFSEAMKNSAANLEFEKAQLNKEKLELLEKFQASSIIVNPRLTDIDVITVVSDEDYSIVNYLHIVNGTILKTKTLEIKKKLNETEEEILLLTLINIQDELESSSRNIITNLEELENKPEGFNFYTPRIGDKHKLLNMSLKNARYRLNQIKEEKRSKLPKHERILAKLQEDLQLKEMPVHIECFDNSNIQGTTPVAAMVCFKNAKPSKADYRHFNIKTVEGPNDFESMREVVFRRYKRLLEENVPLPQLIIIDGGKGQLSFAVRALRELDLYGKIAIIGIAKKLEEIYVPNDPDPIYIDKKSESLKLIQQLRNEAHRFAITFHRAKREKKGISSRLSKIEGVGEKTMESLLREFRSAKGILQAPIEEVAKITGIKKAQAIKDFLEKENNTP